MSGIRRMAKYKEYQVALVRHETKPGQGEIRRNILVFKQWAEFASRAVKKVKSKGWGDRPLVDIEREPGRRIWDTLEIWDGEEVIGINGELKR